MNLREKRHLLTYFTSLCLLSAPAWGDNILVTRTDDLASPPSGVSLRSAILQANASPGSTITFAPVLVGNIITLTSSLPPITKNVSILGSSIPTIIDGNHVGQVFYVSAAGSPVAVTIANINIQNAVAQGGAGGNSFESAGGGGGTGAGGGVFVDRNATVTMQNVSFHQNKAVGGRGGESGNSSFGFGAGGGGGFCGGAGGDSHIQSGAGGGGGDAGGTTGTMDGYGGDAGVQIGELGIGAFGGESSFAVGSGGGGGGGMGVDGTAGTATVSGTVAGSGGQGGGSGGGGGGGVANSVTGVAGSGGTGAFGAGGGGGGFGFQKAGDGGAGGFGAGGGGSGCDGMIGSGIPGAGGIFEGGTGGAGNPNLGIGGGGGGGSGFGGAVFVRDGGTLILQGGSIEGNEAVAGIGGFGNGAENGKPGSARGHDLFIMSGAAVTFDVSSTLTIPSIIESDQRVVGSAGGGIVKAGAGILSLTGDNTYTGGTLIQNGKLVVNGSILGTTNIQRHGTLSGNVSVNHTAGNPGDVINQGKLSPGNSIGTVNIAGNYVQAAKASLEIEINPSGQSDLVSVGGTAVLDGTLFIAPDPGIYTDGQTYTFLTANAISGKFNRVSFLSNVGGQFSADLIYAPNSLGVVIGFIEPFYALVQGGNAGSVASYLSKLDTVVCADLENVTDVLRTLSPEKQRAAFNQLQPSLYGGLALAQEEVSVLVRSAFSRRAWDLHSTGCSAERLKEHKVSLWGDGFHQKIEQRDFGGQKGFNADANGGVLGVDYEIARNVYVGIMGSYTHAHLDWNSSYGDADINTWYAGFYETWSNDSFFVDVAGFGGRNRYKCMRHIDFSSINRRAYNEHDGYELLGSLSTGWSGHIKRFLMQPFLRFDYNYYHEDSFIEHGAACINLKVKQQKSNLLRSEAGLNLSYCGKLPKAEIVPGLSLSYVRESRFYGRHYRAAFKRYRNKNGFFTASTDAPSRNLFVPEATLEALLFKDRLSLKAFYGAAIGKHYWQQEVGGHIGWSF